MTILNFYVHEIIPDHTLVNLLSEIFQVSKEEVSGLYQDKDCSIAFEISVLDDSAMFSTEVNVYTNPDIMRQANIYNSLLLGRLVSKKLESEVLVNDESDDPDQWILVDGENIYLVRDDSGESDGITVNCNEKKQLSFQFALDLLPNRENFKDDKINNSAYLVIPSIKWNKGVLG